MKSYIIFNVLCLSAVLAADNTGRIVNGELDEIEQKPYVVSLRYNGSYYCSGSILAKTFILTAASCNRPIPKDIKVRVGSKFYARKGKTIKAKEFIEHKGFNPDTLEKDIAVIVLEKPMVYKQTVRPIALPKQDGKLPDAGEFVTISGWGTTDPEDNITISQEMRSVDLPMISKKVCKMCHPKKEITKYMFCAGYFLGGKGPTFEDTGGPVIYKGIQYGVVSMAGGGDTYPLSPAILTSVPALREFIKSVTKL